MPKQNGQVSSSVLITVKTETDKERRIEFECFFAPQSEANMHKPIISDQFRNTTAAVGETVRLVCGVTSQLHPSILIIEHYQVNGSYKMENGTSYYRAIPAHKVDERFAIQHVTARHRLPSLQFHCFTCTFSKAHSLGSDSK